MPVDMIGGCCRYVYVWQELSGSGGRSSQREVNTVIESALLTIISVDYQFVRIGLCRKPSRDVSLSTAHALQISNVTWCNRSRAERARRRDHVSHEELRGPAGGEVVKSIVSLAVVRLYPLGEYDRAVTMQNVTGYQGHMRRTRTGSSKMVNCCCVTTPLCCKW